MLSCVGQSLVTSPQNAVDLYVLHKQLQLLVRDAQELVAPSIMGNVQKKRGCDTVCIS